MDSAYDHIQEESYPDEDAAKAGNDSSNQSNDFNAEIQDAYKAISSSPWAARLGGFLGTVKKQGEQYYDGAQKSATAASATAASGLSSIISRTRTLSIQNPSSDQSVNLKDKDASVPEESERATGADTQPHPDRPESLPADIVKEAEGMLSRFRSEAAKRLKDIERAEDAADEALLKFGSNIRSFLRDAVTIAPPSSPGSAEHPNKVLFESKDSEGKRVIHTTRFDAQLHVIHSSLDSFLKDPVSPEWQRWSAGFDVEKKTEAIAKDLAKHEELRRAMERLAPERVEYAVFWCRYYFLRHVIESEEQKRREMLRKASQTAPIEEEVAWDEDSEAESESESNTSTPNPNSTTKTPTANTNPHNNNNSNSNSNSNNMAASKETLKPESAAAAAGESRPSHDEKSSQADSDASYDVVSGATSRAPGSPSREKRVVEEEESDEEDWE